MKLDIQKFAVTKSTKFTESNISVENNTSSLKITIEFSANNDNTYFSSETLTCTCNGVTKSAQVSHPRNGSAKKSFTFNNIQHNSDGTKAVDWSWECKTGTNVLGTQSASGRKTLTTINRYGRVTGVSGNTTNSPITITWQSYKADYSYDLMIQKEGVGEFKTYSDLDSSVGEHTIQINVEDTFFNGYSNSTTAPIIYTIVSYIEDDDIYYEDYNSTINLNSSVVPSVSIGTLTEANTTMQSLNWGVFVQNKSQLNIPIIANGIYDSTIQSIVTTINGMSFTGNPVITSTLVTPGINTISTTITDTRGRTATTTKTYTVVDYTNPIIEIAQVQRCLYDGTLSDNGTYLLIDFKGTISDVSNNNTATWRIGYKKTTDLAYTYVTLGNNYLINLEDQVSSFTISPDYEYDIIFEATDAFMTSSIDRLIDTGFDLLNFNPSGKSIAIGKVSTASSSEELLEINLETVFLEDITTQDITAEDINCNSINATGGTCNFDAITINNIDPFETTTGNLTITKTSGDSTVTGTYAKYGNIVFCDLLITTTATISAGSNIFEGAISTFTPAIGSSFVGYIGDRSIIALFDTDNSLTIRNASSNSINSNSTIKIRGELII